MNRWKEGWKDEWMNEWINTSEDNKPSSQDSLCYFLTQRFHPISHQAHTQNLHSSGVLLGIQGQGQGKGQGQGPGPGPGLD